MTILVIDDSASVREVLRVALMAEEDSASSGTFGGERSFIAMQSTGR